MAPWHYRRIVLLLLLANTANAADITVAVRDGGGAPLADAVVYLEPGGARSGAASEIRIEQKNKEFRPFVSAARAGAVAWFPNRDGIGHHVYSFSEAKTFQLPLSEAEVTEPVTLDKPGIVTVGCNIHDWMVGYIYVVDTPHFAVTGGDGTAGLAGVPAGEYTLHVWHPGSRSDREIEQAFTLGEGETRRLSFDIDVRPAYFWKPSRPPENEEALY